MDPTMCYMDDLALRLDATDDNGEAKRVPHLPPLPSRPPSPPTRLPFRIRTLGRVRNQPYHSTAGTYHHDAMFTLFRSGSGLYHRKGHVQRIGAGVAGLVLPSSDPGLLIADTGDPYDHYFCRFAGYEALRMAKAIAGQHGGARFFEYSRWPEAMMILDSMLNLDSAQPATPPWMNQGDAELARLLALLLAAPAPNERPLNEPNLRRYMSDRLAEPFELEPMARHFGTSRFTLSRRARAILGESLSEASRRLKLEFARSLLDAPALDLSIAEVALRSGYQDPLYFSRIFRRQFSVSPSTYRESVRRGRR